MSEQDRTRGIRGGTGRGREVALNLGALAGMVCIVAAAASMFVGVTPLVFRSGSMSPEIPTGALALAVTVSGTDLAVGDVVSVVTPGEVRITHRVSGLAPAGDGTVAVTLRGDANDADDPAPYLLREADRVFFHVDGLGYLVAWLSNPVAIFLGGMLAGALSVIAFGRTRRRDGDDNDGDDRLHGHGSGACEREKSHE